MSLEYDKRIIDPSQVPIHGWEIEKDYRKIWSMSQLLINGFCFPAVHVNERVDEGYNLDQVGTVDDDPELNEGGHNRTLAHIIAEKSMIVRLVKSELYRPELVPIPVTSIRLSALDHVYEYYRVQYNDKTDVPMGELDRMKIRLLAVHRGLFG